MKESKYTEEQIRTEVHKVLANPQLRQCSHCIHGASLTRCEKLNIPITRFQYCGNCKFFMTNEEKLMQEAREAVARLEREESKMNHVLTMVLNAIEAAMLYLEDFEARVEKEYRRAEARGTGDPRVRKNDRAWIALLSRAFKQMKKDSESMRRQYTHFVEPQLNKVFMDKETGVYDVQSYDDHQQDAHELARIMMKYFDKSYLNFENAQSIESHIDSLEGVGVMMEEDYKRYNLKR